MAKFPELSKRLKTLELRLQEAENKINMKDAVVDNTIDYGSFGDDND